MSAKKSVKKSGEPMRLYLVDASSYAFRAFHATERQGLSTSQGLPTGATLVFTNMILKLIREERPTHLVVVWDAKGKTFRHDMYEEYKANRAKMPSELSLQIGHMREIVEAMNLPAMEMTGYEADDVIGSISKRAAEDKIETVIVTGDKDLTQLVGPEVTMLDTMKDARTDAKGVKDKFGVEPERVVEVLALWGDSSDNIPGVPKVGEKTARSLIEEYGTMEAVLEHAAEVKGKVGENLKEFADQARLSKKLVTIVTDLPLEINWEDLRIREPDREKLSGIFRELEFNKLRHEFSGEKSRVSYDGYGLITDPKELSAFVKKAEKMGALSVDTETSSTDPMQAELVGISMAIEPGAAVYVPLAHIGPGSEAQIKKRDAMKILAPLLQSDKVAKVGQNLKYDFIVLKRQGVDMGAIAFDTMIASYLLNPKRRTHNLEELSSEYLGHGMIKYEDVCGKGKAQIPFAEVAVEDAMRYSGEDSDVALLLKEVLEPKLEESGLTRIFSEIEMPLLPVLARMEMAGVKVEVKLLKELSKKFDQEIGKLRKKIHELAHEEFNIDSPIQLSKILFEKLKLPATKKTKTGYSTSVEVLTGLAEQHEVPGLVLEYRSLSKLKSTYTDALARLVNAETKRIHTSYNQTVTSTGRLSSSDPNLQNIPVRSSEGRMIREAFVGEGQNVILSADYSQVELRLMAHISEEPALVESFQRGEDIHARTATEVFGVKADQVTSDMRRHAKVINFGILYGMSAHGLSVQLKIDRKEAQAYIDTYFQGYPRVKKYMENIVAEARATGFVKTIMGRKMPLPELHSANHLVRQAAEREAINAPLQGSAADIIKIAMIRIDRALQKKRLASRMIMQVHDELVFEASPLEIEELTQLVRKEMESAARLKVKLEVDVSFGRSWAEAH